MSGPVLARLATLLVGALLCCGCSPHLTVRQTVVPDHHQSDVDALLLLAVVEAGPDEAYLAHLFVDAVRDENWFAVADRRRVVDDVAASADGRWRIRPASAAPGDRQLGVLLKLEEWDAIGTELVKREEWSDHGGPGARSREVHALERVRCRMTMSLIADDGRERLAVRAEATVYRAPRGVPPRGFIDPDTRRPLPVLAGDRGELRRAAARRAIDDLLAAITPCQRETLIPLAGGGEVERAVELAVAGELTQAESLLRTAVEGSGPTTADLFNLAAVIDAQGRHREALEWYARALAREPRDRWRSVMAECAARAETAEQALPGAL